MKNQSTYLIIFSFVILHLSAQEFSYPIAEPNPITDNYWGIEVTDDYRWFEDMNNEKVKIWIEQQNDLSKKHLRKATAKHDAHIMIEKYANITFSKPVRDGEYYFGVAWGYTGNPELYYKSRLRGEWESLIDFNYNFGNDRIDLRNYMVSGNSKYMAYSISRNGSEWEEIQIINLTTRNRLKDHLINVKFSSIAWKDDGFYYCRFDREKELNISVGQKIYYHKLGEDQANDQLIIGEDNSLKIYSCMTSYDEQFFIINENNDAKNIYSIYYIDFTSGINTIRPLFVNQSNNNMIDIQDAHNGKLIGIANGKNNGMVIEINPANPINPRLIVPEYSDALLIRGLVMKNNLILVYQSNQNYFIDVNDYDGNLLKTLSMPLACSVNGFFGMPDDEEVVFYLSSYYIPPNVYTLNVNTYKTKILDNTKLRFDHTKFEIKSEIYTSKDGTKVPIFIMYKKGLKLDGNNPALLKAYGGFGGVDMPSFDPGIVYILEKGCVYAFANIRGGGDLGLEWELEGKGLKKQNSIDDFIWAAEYLIKNNYTNPSKLGITGRGNGGLIAAAAMIQRPELYRVVMPDFARTDMIRFEKFTVESYLTSEYGSVNDSLDFRNLLSYSPFHNIDKDVNYPSVFLLTAENDNRIPPFHSYKFAAALQNGDNQENLILLKVMPDMGHSGTNSHYEFIKRKEDLYSFFFNEVND